MNKKSLEVAHKEIEALVIDTLGARMSIALSELHETKEEAKAILEDFRQKEFQVKEQWAAELTRSFLPRFVWNRGSNGPTKFILSRMRFLLRLALSSEIRKISC